MLSTISASRKIRSPLSTKWVKLTPKLSHFFGPGTWTIFTVLSIGHHFQKSSYTVCRKPHTFSSFFSAQKSRSLELRWGPFSLFSLKLMFKRLKSESLRDVSVARIGGDTLSYGFSQTVLFLTLRQLWISRETEKNWKGIDSCSRSGGSRPYYPAMNF